MKILDESVDSEILRIMPVGAITKGVLDAAPVAKSANVDYLLLMPTQYAYPTAGSAEHGGLEKYCRMYYEAHECPLLLYLKSDFPQGGFDVLERLADDGVCAGVKYADPNVNNLRIFMKRFGGKLSVSCGLAERFIPFMAVLGVKAFTTGFGNIAPSVSLLIFKLIGEGKIEEAMPWLETAWKMEDSRARRNSGLNQSSLHYAMEKSGMSDAPTSMIYDRVNSDEAAEIDSFLPEILGAEQRAAALLAE